MRPSEDYLWAVAGEDWGSPAARAAEIVFNVEAEPVVIQVMQDAVEVVWGHDHNWAELLVRDDGHYFAASQREGVSR